MDKKYKQSNYNFIYDNSDKDGVIIYNARTGALATLKEKQYKIFQDYLLLGTNIEDLEFEKKLLQCGFLIHKDVDEKFLIKTGLMKGRYNTNRLSLTIAPTMACNFRCIYCFEQGQYKNSIMNQDTMENTIKFVRNHISNVKYLHISWFGGEPLMAMSVIELLSEKLIQLCEENGIEYSANIVTNGYLMTREVAEKLKEYQVKSVQVTIDGCRSIHDLRRPLANGKGTYDQIMKNLIEVSNVLPINIRINVDSRNLNSVNEVAQFLKSHNLQNTIYPYLAMVVPVEGVYQEQDCISDKAYSKQNIKFMIDNQLSLTYAYPFPKSNYCMADSCNGWVIDSEGYLYKCWCDIGNEEKQMGSIDSECKYVDRSKLINSYLEFDPTIDEKCSACKVLPICMGGCPNSRLKGQMACAEKKYNLQEYIIEYTKTFTEYY